MASDLSEPFTPESARELHDHLQAAWPRDRALSTDMLQLYWNQKAVTLPDTNSPDRAIRYEPEKVTTQEAMRIVDLFTSMFMKPAPPSLIHRDEGMGRTEDRERVEQALTLTRTQVDHHHRVRLARVRGQITVGRGAQLGPLPGGEHWWNYPYREPGESLEGSKARKREWMKSAPGLPFVYIELPPESTFPASLGYQNDLVGTVLQLTYYDLCAIFSEDELAKALPEKPKKASEEFTLFMASNRSYLTYMLMAGGGVTVPIVGQIGGRRDSELRQIQHGMGAQSSAHRPASPAPAGRGRWGITGCRRCSR